MPNGADPQDGDGASRTWLRSVLSFALLVVIFGGNFFVTILNTDSGTILWWIQALAAGALALLNVPNIRRRKRTAVAGATEQQRPLTTTLLSFDPVPPDPTPEAAVEPRAWPPTRVMWLRRVRPRRPSNLPFKLPTFTGRTSELDFLHQELRRRREHAGHSTVSGRPGRNRRRRLSQAERTPVLLIHGMPGIGKSALAQEFAHRVSRYYPDGQLYANLGSAGAPRAVGEILREFLLDLGWSERRMPEDTKMRGDVFRSLTRDRRILVLLDAARDSTQVEALLPGGRLGAVVVTARRDLAADLGAGALRLTVPDLNESVAILDGIAAATQDDPAPDPVATRNVARLCGQLPLALCAAAAIPRYGDTESSYWQGVATQLADRQRRLDLLTHDGSNVKALIATEYSRLLDREKDALCALTLVRSHAIVPWVLCPMLGIDLLEAEKLMARLREVHLLEAAAPDTPVGLARYRFHPLVRIFAESEAAQRPDAALSVAQQRLNMAYRGIARAVLNRAGEHVEADEEVAAAENVSLPDDESLKHIALWPDAWIRMEHESLAQVVFSAHDDREWGLCWRVAARLGESIPRAEAVDVIRQALRVGLDAAHRTGDVSDQLSVRCADAVMLVLLEHYTEAFAAIAHIVQGAHDHHMHDLHARALRLRAQAHVQMGAYQHAATDLAQAQDQAMQAGDAGFRELERIRQLRHICEGRRSPEQWRADATSETSSGLDDWRQYHSHLIQAEAARRTSRWDDAKRHLERAWHKYSADLHRTAAIEYRTAKLWLTRHRAAKAGKDADSHLSAALDHAARAVLTFHDINVRRGEIRARCLLARVLAAAGGHSEAEAELGVAHGLLTALNDLHDEADALLRARWLRARGELTLRQIAKDPAPWQRKPKHVQQPETLAATITMLEEAIKIFHSQRDWWSEADTQIWLGRAHHTAHQIPTAFSCLAQAVDQFHRGKDEVGLAHAVVELSRVGTPSLWANMTRGA